MFPPLHIPYIATDIYILFMSIYVLASPISNAIKEQFLEFVVVLHLSRPPVSKLYLWTENFSLLFPAWLYRLSMFSHLSVAIHSTLFSSGKCFPIVSLINLQKYLSCFISISTYTCLTVPNRFKNKDILTDFFLNWDFITQRLQNKNIQIWV